MHALVVAHGDPGRLDPRIQTTSDSSAGHRPHRAPRPTPDCSPAATRAACRCRPTPAERPTNDRVTLASVSNRGSADVVVRHDRWSSNAGLIRSRTRHPLSMRTRDCAGRPGSLLCAAPFARSRMRTRTSRWDVGPSTGGCAACRCGWSSARATSHRARCPSRCEPAASRAARDGRTRGRDGRDPRAGAGGAASSGDNAARPARPSRPHDRGSRRAGARRGRACHGPRWGGKASSVCSSTGSRSPASFVRQQASRRPRERRRRRDRRARLLTLLGSASPAAPQLRGLPLVGGSCGTGRSARC